MKLLIFKINSLLLLAVGVILGAHAFEIPQVEDYWQQGLEYYVQNTFVVLAIAGVVLFVFGLYGVLPKLANRSDRRSIHFTGAHGEVVIQLDSVQATLTKIMTNMPEVRKVDVKVDPDKKRERAIINADVILEKQPDADARQTANVVTSYIAETAIRMLGLEDLATVNLKIVGFHMNPKKASKSIRASRAAHELGRPVGQLTHVEVSENAPDMFEETPNPEDAGLRSAPGSRVLQTAGEMMAELGESEVNAEATPDELDREVAGENGAEMTKRFDLEDEAAEAQLPPLAQADAVETEDSDELIPSVDFGDETTELGIHPAAEKTGDPIAADAAEDEVKDDTDKKDKGGWGFV